MSDVRLSVREEDELPVIYPSPSLTSPATPLPIPHLSYPSSSLPATRPSPQLPLRLPSSPQIPLRLPSSLTCHPTLTSGTPPLSSPAIRSSLQVLLPPSLTSVTPPPLLHLSYPSQPTSILSLGSTTLYVQ
ncbi:hypothetical protein Pmani_031589 [Petrolisthes manimaculis]|uniref:Uncharacterized protein n=1 Tax=Petrolisthes manimaculis TaxID=1843537 RepID=A0AAE1NV27_9EUCA|nr:hypothetical protein Pmani_031589 [Petrolisthes manimaculis]